VEGRQEVHTLVIGYRADTTPTEDLRALSRAANPIGEMTRQLDEAQALARPLEGGIADVFRPSPEYGATARLPESVASSRGLLGFVRSAALEEAVNPGGAWGSTLHQVGRLNRLFGR
jgi:hypothetical protein